MILYCVGMAIKAFVSQRKSSHEMLSLNKQLQHKDYKITIENTKPRGQLGNVTLKQM